MSSWQGMPIGQNNGWTRRSDEVHRSECSSLMCSSLYFIDYLALPFEVVLFPISYSYYVGQLSLHAMQCLGRSYNCISWIEKSFSYTMLCSLCYNPYLPPKIRGGATNLVKALYLDRFPQLTNCGRPSLPQQLWVNSLSKACTLDPRVVPLIKPLVLANEGSLPEFCLTSSHKLSGDPNPFYGFPSQTKFFLLRRFGNEYLRGFGNGSVVHAGMQDNALASNVVR